MRKKTLNYIFLCFVSLFIFSCNPRTGDSTKIDIAAFDSCLNDCANKEKACWDEYDRCKGQAATEEQAALNTCSHLPPPNVFECRSQAVSNYRDKVDQCEKKLRACLEELKNCRKGCGDQYTKLPDTR